MTAARFTQEDRLRPTYCHTCHTRIPRLSKEVNGGLCSKCAGSGKSEAKEILERHQHLLDAKKQVMKGHSTGLGECPSCHSQNLIDIPTTTPNSVRLPLIFGGLALMGSGLGAFQYLGASDVALIASVSGVGLLLLTVGLFVPSHKVISKTRTCNFCSNRWLV